MKRDVPHLVLLQAHCDAVSFSVTARRQAGLSSITKQSQKSATRAHETVAKMSVTDSLELLHSDLSSERGRKDDSQLEQPMKGAAWRDGERDRRTISPSLGSLSPMA